MAAKLKAATMVPLDYPDSSPVFSLELDWHGKHSRSNSEIVRVLIDSHLIFYCVGISPETNILFFLYLPQQNVEAQVNVLHGELDVKHKIDLLSIQLKTLLMHLDLLTEVDGQLAKKGKGSWQSSSQSSVEFPAEKMVPQLIKGHDRIPPTQFDAATGFFLHR